MFSTRMSSSWRSRSRSVPVFAENMPLQVLGVPLVPPRFGIWARRHHAEMTFMNDLGFGRRASALCPHKFFYVAAEGVDELVGRRGIRLEWLVDEVLEAGERDSEARLRRDSEFVDIY